VTVAKTWAASKDRDRERLPALRGRTGGLPKNVHIMVKIDRANRARPSSASPCPGQPGIPPFFKNLE